MTPCEVKDWIGARTEASVYDAWMVGLFHHWNPEKYPHSPDHLLKPREATVDDMLSLLERYAAAQGQPQEPPKPPSAPLPAPLSPKRLRRRDPRKKK